MFKGVCLTFVALLLSFSGTAIGETRPDVLVAVHISDSEAIGLLRELPVSVNYRGYNYLIATVNAHDIERLRSAAIEFEIIDDEAWSQPYFLITRPKGEELGHIPDVGNVVFQTEREACVKIAPDETHELGRAGFQLMRIFSKPLPIIETRRIAPDRLRDKLQTGSRADDVIGIIVNQVSQDVCRSYVQRLQDFQTRFFASDSIWAAAQWLYDRFVEFGYTDVVFDDFVDPDYGVPVRNVIATKRGTLYPDSVIIIGGHYDSIVYDGTDWFVWAPGADDNASGTVGVLEAARILADIDLDCTVKFACWTA